MSRFNALLLMALPLAACAGGPGFQVTGGALRDGATLPSAQVYRGSGCNGANHSPMLAWSGAPAGTRSYAVTMFDRDAPTGNGWWHWLAYDLPESTQSLPEDAGRADGGALPPGARQARNDFGGAGYGGACPPAGAGPHRYVITIYALPVARLPLPAAASAETIGDLLQQDALATARLSTRYSR